MSAPAVGPDGELFTRGGPNVPDNRGQSMVEKHLEKLQKEKEAKAMEKIQLLMPAMTNPAVLSLALEECHFDVDRAVVMLRRFQAAKAKELHVLNKERKKLELERERAKRRREEEGEKKQRRGRGSGDSSSGSESDSGSSSSDDSGSDSSDSEDERRRRKDKKSSKKRRRRSPSSSRSRSPKRSSKKKRSSKDRQDRKKKEKEKEKKRRSKDKAKAKTSKGTTAAVRQEEYGKYGIIRETDMYSKRPEFQLWAAEVRKIDVEIMPKFEEKELFKDFMEEYNTATLPHRKYYDLDLWERRKAIKAAQKGLPAGPVDRTAFDDEAELKRERAAQRAKEQQERLKQAYDELLHTDKARDMREQELLRMKMGLEYRTGNVEEARKLAEKLKPDDPAELARRR